jgi:hypothetical protein
VQYRVGLKGRLDFRWEKIGNERTKDSILSMEKKMKSTARGKKSLCLRK